MGNRFREKVTEEGLENEVRKEVKGRRGAEGGGEKVESEVPTDFQNDEVEEEKKPLKGGKAARGVAKVLGGDILADKYVLKQIPLLLLCLIFLLLLVANRYRVESLSREKEAVEERINDLREERIQMQKQYQKSVKISQIAEELGESGVGITSGPPYELK